MPQKTHHRSRTSNTRPRSQARQSISIIGAGRLGTALGIALRSANYEIDLVVTKHAASARRSARLTGARAGLTWKEFAAHPNACGKSRVIIVATPDDVIAKVAGQLTAFLGSGLPRGSIQRTAIHTSGALSSEVLRPLRLSGFAVATLHPLLSISDPRLGAAAFAGAFFSLEGDASAIQTGKRLVSDLGGQSFTIRPRDKALYHAAALMASPNMTALFDIALEMLNRCGLTPKRARQVLLPLVKSTLDNLVRQNPSQALTGTFRRRDLATVRSHLAAIESAKLADALGAYVLLGRRSLKLAKSHNDSNTRAIESLLARADQQRARKA
jgi:predicted short-subunit dehydrogenase-like oxidoreductase (DUF2520 family)